MRRLFLPLIVLLALGVRLNCLLHLEVYPRFELIKNRLDDQVFLDSWAKAILRGDPPPLADSPHEFAYWAAQTPGVFPQAPLYAYLLALQYRVFGFHYDAVRAVQLVCGVVAVAFITLIGTRLFGVTAGTCSGLAAALYGPFVFYESTFLIDALTVFFSAAMLFALTAMERARTHGTREQWHALAAGIVLGLAGLLRPNFLLFAVGAVVRCLRSHRAVAVGLGLALPLLPVVALNSARSGALAFVSSNVPFNFFIGNVHDAAGSVATTTPTYLALKELSRSQPVSLSAAALNDIRRHPLGFVRLQLRKIALLFDGYEIPDNLNYYLGRDTNPALRWAPVEYWMVVPLGVTGIVLAWLSRQPTALALLLLITHTVSVTAFFVVSRLRLPAVVPLLLFAGYAVSWCVSEVQQRRRLRPALVAAVAVAGAVMLRPDGDGLVRAVDYKMAAASYVSLGQNLEHSGDRLRAHDAYLHALLYSPSDDTILARVQPGAETGTVDVAPEIMRELNDLWAQTRALAQSHQYTEAESAVRRAIELAPQVTTSYQYLANVAFLEGKRAEAIAALEQALIRDPANPLVRRNLAQLRDGT